VLKVLKFFDADPGPGSFRPGIRDGAIPIDDEHPIFTALVKSKPKVNFFSSFQL
jgi:hypothetical protein